ncbi:MAG TPA: tRNA1(Val) (adenine(37)-N6)-methyltransferase [Candidatus Binatia bacterium]|jgi:tRNA1Val (adenine37-N6)-methyltransferase
MGKQNLSDETLDALLRGRLSVIQSKTGYRFSLDALLLAHFAAAQGAERVIDLGTGNGVVALILAALGPALKVTGLEIQEPMAQRAARSVALNDLTGRVSIVQGDVRKIKRNFSAGRFDVAVCNPPYRGLGSGRINPDGEKRVARHEIAADLPDFLRAAAYLLRRGGRIAVVYPATRMVDLLHTMREARLEPKRIRLVHSFAESGAAFVLAEGIKGAGSELKIMPPLIVYAKEREYTPEMSAILAGEAF